MTVAHWLLSTFARRAVAAALVLAALRAPGAAQEIVPLPRPDGQPRSAGPMRPQTLRLADLEGIAMANNPTLMQAAAAIEMQRGIWEQVGLYPNPFSGYLNASSNDPTQRNNGIFLSQEIVTGKKRQLARDVEYAELSRLAWAQHAQRHRVLNDLRIRYYEVLGSQRGVEIAGDLHRSAEEGLAAAESAYKAQEASKADLLQARIHRNTARIALQDARYRYEAAWHQMATLIGVPQLGPVTVEGALDEEVRPAPFEQAFEELIAASPQVREADLRVEIARREMVREQAQPIPNVTLQTVAEWNRAQGDTTVSTLVAVPIPFYNRNQGNIYHTFSTIQEAAAEAQRVRLVLRDLLTDAYRRLQTAQFQVERLRRDVLPDAKENLEIVSTGRKTGEFTLFQVLVARQTHAQSQLAYAEALTELQKVNVEVTGLLLTGGLNPAELGAALQMQGAGGMRQRAVLNQIQESTSNKLLPPALQSLHP